MLDFGVIYFFLEQFKLQDDRKEEGEERTYERNTVAAGLGGQDVLMLVDKGIDAIVLQSLDDGVGDVQVGLVVLPTDWLHTRPMYTYITVFIRPEKRGVMVSYRCHTTPTTTDTQQKNYQRLTETNDIDVQILEVLDIPIHERISRNKVVDVRMPGELFLDHVGSMEMTGSTLSIDELLAGLVDADDFGDLCVGEGR